MIKTTTDITTNTNELPIADLKTTLAATEFCKHNKHLVDEAYHKAGTGGNLADVSAFLTDRFGMRFVDGRTKQVMDAAGCKRELRAAPGFGKHPKPSRSKRMKALEGEEVTKTLAEILEEMRALRSTIEDIATRPTPPVTSTEVLGVQLGNTGRE